MNPRRETIGPENRRGRVWPWALVVVLAWFLVHVASRPSHAESPPPAAPPQSKSPIEYVGPDTFILLDAEGRPAPVLGMNYEEFVAAWKKSQQLAAPEDQPRFTIEELKIAGRAKESSVELEVDVTIRIRSDGPISVPLGMANGILREPPQWESAGKNEYVDFDRQQGGFLMHLHGQPNELRKISLQMLAPLVRDGAATSLQLNCPRALVGRFSLDVPTAGVHATASEGSTVASDSTDGSGTRIRADGLVGDFRLTWIEPEAQRPELATVLSAIGAIAISIDGHSIRSNAHLSVRSYGGSFDRFRVRLPPGARLIQERRLEGVVSSPGHRLSVESAPQNGESSADEGDAQQIVLVELPEKQFGPVEIDLATEQPLGLSGADRAEELGGFEVLDSVRQFGDVALHVADDWQLRSVLGPYIRQVDRGDLPPVLAATNATAAFQYDRQPWSLRAQIDTRPLQVNVSPEYNLELGSDEARMRVHLMYQVPGARTFEFRMQLNGWELTSDPIESNSLVDRDGILVTRDGVLVLPLTQASPRRAEIVLTLRREMRRYVTEVQIPLPQPLADSTSGAVLAVSTSAGVEIMPNLSLSRGLAPAPITENGPDSAFDEGRQLFRYQAFLPDAMLVAERSIRPSDVSARVATRLTIGTEGSTAVQSIDYLVQYQPVDQIAIDVPEDWSIVGEKLEIGAAGDTSDDPLRGEGSVDPRAILAATPEAATRIGQSLRYTFALPQPRIGRFRVRLRYESVLPPDLAERSALQRLRLAQPVATRITENRVTVAAQEPLAAALDPSGATVWESVDGPGSGHDVGELELRALHPNEPLPLVVQRSGGDKSPTVRVERVWLQIWQAGNVVQNRAAFRFRGKSSAVTVEMPPSVSTDQVEVLLDGDVAHVASRQNGRLTVDVSQLPQSNVTTVPAHTLELRYRQPGPTGLFARREIMPPQLIGISELNDIYWHVVLPGDVHIVRPPAQWVAADRWQWWEVFWGRSPAMRQPDLEAWIGATEQTSPSAAQNEYLFSSLASVGSIEFVTAPRWLIVLLASSAVLAIVVAWMYVPVARRPWIGILLAIAVAGGAVAYPMPAVLLGQASLLGGVVAIVALWLRGSFARPTTRPLASAGSTNLRLTPAPRLESMATPVLTSQGSGVSVSTAPMPGSE